MNVLDLFSAAAGGWSLGMHRAGFKTVAACESVAWRRALYAQNNPGVLIYDDVCTLTADRLVRDLGYLPDVVVGSPPCQDISSANTKGKGVEGERSGLYFEAIRIIGEVRPRWFALENSSNLRTRGADAVLAALEAIGYACWPFVVRAGDIGANHERPRAWLIGCDIGQVANPHLQPIRGTEQSRPEGSWHYLPGTRPTIGDSRGSDGSGAIQGRHGGLGETTNADGVGQDAGRQGWGRGLDLPLSDDPGHTAAEDGCGQRRQGRRALATEGLPVEACRDDANTTQERSEGFARSELAGSSEEPEYSNVTSGCEMGGSAGASLVAPEPWAEWNSGLAGHLRVDDGLSAWVAGTRIAVGGTLGTSAASLLVEAFGDAVVPQIPEAIGRSILRTEQALAAVYGSAAA
jgi:DNA (cytosine-5)-methyltransferase 1